jgi:hypothetical protein
MLCKTFYPAGSSECNAVRGRYAGFLLLALGIEIAASGAEAIAALKTLLAGKTAGIKATFIDTGNGYTNDTPEPEMQTGVVGGTMKSYDPPTEYTAYMRSNYCDYFNLYSADNQDFLVIPVLPDGSLEVKKKANGNYTGCRATIMTRVNGSRPDASQESYPVYIKYQNAEDVKKVGILKTEYDVEEIKESIPVGLAATVVTAYASSEVTVQVTKRCTSTPNNALTATTNWTVLEIELGSTDAGVNVSNVTDAGSGLYDLEIQTSAPADITDNCLIQGFVDDGTYYTHITNALEIVV